MISFTCTKCPYSKNVTDKFSGKKVICPKCKSVSRVPVATPKTIDADSAIKSTCHKITAKSVASTKSKRFDKDKFVEQSKAAAIFSGQKLSEFYVYLRPHVINFSKEVWRGSVYCTKLAHDKFQLYRETIRQQNAAIHEARHQQAVELEEIRLRQSSGMSITPEESLRLRNSESALKQGSPPATNQSSAELGALSIAIMFGMFLICCGGGLGIFGTFLGGASSAPHPYGFTDAEAMEHGEKILNGEMSIWDDPRDTPRRGSDAWYEDDDVKYSDKVIEFSRGKTWDDFK